MVDSLQQLDTPRDSNRHYNLSVSGIVTIKASTGTLERLMVNDASAKTLKIYDSSASTGSLIATLDAPGKGVLQIGLQFSNALTVSAVSASDLTFLYR